MYRFLFQRGNNNIQTFSLSWEAPSSVRMGIFEWSRDSKWCNVEELFLDASGFDMEYWKLQNLDFIHHIEEVTVDLFDGSNGIEFARYKIENAKNLEQMVTSHLPEQCDVRQKLNESKMMML
ncbi:hypothetical protein C1H46_014221 [Malus baccata]|uniref:FBD domain-containing protein n=1 Tax=Malus baccata TaxID=106549 RepID=A0A540MN46_MALBA|nr:hypothetical protein C1H46_014221 [Malus baccata]